MIIRTLDVCTEFTGQLPRNSDQMIKVWLPYAGVSKGTTVCGSLRVLLEVTDAMGTSFPQAHKLTRRVWQAEIL